MFGINLSVLVNNIISDTTSVMEHKRFKKKSSPGLHPWAFVVSNFHQRPA